MRVTHCPRSGAWTTFDDDNDDSDSANITLVPAGELANPHTLPRTRSQNSPSLTVVLAADEVVVLQLTLLLVRVGGAADDELSAPTDSDRSMMAAAAGLYTARTRTEPRTCTPVRSHANTRTKSAA